MAHNIKRLELVYIKDKLEQALALAKNGGHVIADSIEDDIKEINGYIQDINDEERAEQSSNTNDGEISVAVTFPDSELPDQPLAVAS